MRPLHVQKASPKIEKMIQPLHAQKFIEKSSFCTCYIHILTFSFLLTQFVPPKAGRITINWLIGEIVHSVRYIHLMS
jgi:hypothetical protein